MSLGSNGVDRVHSLRTIPTRLRCKNFCPSSACFVPRFVMPPNYPKCTQMVRNAPKHEFRDEWGGSVRSLRKIPTRLRGTNFCTSSARFPPRFVRQSNCPNCTQMVENTPKQQFRVQWGGPDVFVAKNSDATSWHELLH